MKQKISIKWSNSGGALDEVTISHDWNDDRAVTTALMELIRGQIVAPGDVFTVTEID